MSSEALERATVQVRKALDGHFKRGVGGCATCHKGHDALDALLAEVARLEQERDEALERVRVRHGDVRKSSERAEQAYRERDEALAALAVANERGQRAADALRGLMGYARDVDIQAAEIQGGIDFRAALVDEPAAASNLNSARWEVGFLVGPCSRDEALALLEEVSPVVAGRLGAAGAVTLWEEDDPGSSSGKTPGFDPGEAGSIPAPASGSASAAADEPGETPA